MTTKKKGMSREEAGALYKQLQDQMNKLLRNEAEYKAQQAKKATYGRGAAVARAEDLSGVLRSEPRAAVPFNRGHAAAFAFVFFFAGAKVLLSAFEASGFASVSQVAAAGNMPTKQIVQPSVPFSREEVQILTSLDTRRAQLEDRAKKLDQRESDISRRDREFATRLTQLRELTDKLNVEREKGDKKRGAQLEQLANVYGSMNPEEAAHLIEQLDITIAMPLIERMPEKRIGQILAVMNPERALAITKVLSGKAQ